MLAPNWISKTILNSETLDVLRKVRGASVLFAERHTFMEYCTLNTIDGGLKYMQSDGSRERRIGLFLPRLFDVMSSKNWFHILDNILGIYLTDYEKIRKHIFKSLNSKNQTLDAKTTNLILNILKLFRSSLTLRDHTETIPPIKNYDVKVRGFNYYEITLAARILGLENVSRLLVFPESYEDRNYLYRALKLDGDAKNRSWKLNKESKYPQIKTFFARSLFISQGKNNRAQTGECIVFENGGYPDNGEIHAILFNLRAIIRQYEDMLEGTYQNLDFYIDQEVNKFMDEIPTLFEVRLRRGRFYEALKNFIEEIFEGQTFFTDKYVAGINEYFPQHNPHSIYDWLSQSSKLSTKTMTKWSMRMCTKENQSRVLALDEIDDLLNDISQDSKIYQSSLIKVNNIAGNQGGYAGPNLFSERNIFGAAVMHSNNSEERAQCIGNYSQILSHDNNKASDVNHFPSDWIHSPIFNQSSLRFLNTAYGANLLLGPMDRNNIIRPIPGPLNNMQYDKARDDLIGPFLPQLFNVARHKNWLHIIENILKIYIPNYDQQIDLCIQGKLASNNTLNEQIIKKFANTVLDVLRSAITLKERMRPIPIGSSAKRTFRGFLYEDVFLAAKILGLESVDQLLIFSKDFKERNELYGSLKKESKGRRLPLPQTTYSQIKTFPAEGLFILKPSKKTKDQVQVGECIVFDFANQFNSEIHGVLFNLRAIIRQYQDFLDGKVIKDLGSYIAQESNQSTSRTWVLFELRRVHSRFYEALKELIEYAFEGSKFNIENYTQKVDRDFPQPDILTMRNWIHNFIYISDSTRKYWYEKISMANENIPLSLDEIDRFIKDFGSNQSIQGGDVAGCAMSSSSPNSSSNSNSTSSLKRPSQTRTKFYSSRNKFISTKKKRASADSETNIDIDKELQEAMDEIDDLVSSGSDGDIVEIFSQEGDESEDIRTKTTKRSDYRASFRSSGKSRVCDIADQNFDDDEPQAPAQAFRHPPSNTVKFGFATGIETGTESSRPLSSPAPTSLFISARSGVNYSMNERERDSDGEDTGIGNAPVYSMEWFVNNR